MNTKLSHANSKIENNYRFTRLKIDYYLITREYDPFITITIFNCVSNIVEVF